MTAEAVRYYIPALVRVALDLNLKGNPPNFVSSLLFDLGLHDLNTFALFHMKERNTVLMLLKHLKGSMSERYVYDEDESVELEPLIEKRTRFSKEN